MKFPFARSGADRLDAVDGSDGGSTGRRAAIFPDERPGPGGLVFAGLDSASAVVTNPCPNDSPINVNIKIKRIASDSFK
jgi:hypothetical protein